jgi:hypothetical protein
MEGRFRNEELSSVEISDRPLISVDANSHHGVTGATPTCSTSSGRVVGHLKTLVASQCVVPRHPLISLIPSTANHPLFEVQPSSSQGHDLRLEFGRQ